MGDASNKILLGIGVLVLAATAWIVFSPPVTESTSVSRPSSPSTTSSTQSSTSVVPRAKGFNEAQKTSNWIILPLSTKTQKHYTGNFRYLKAGAKSRFVLIKVRVSNTSNVPVSWETFANKFYIEARGNKYAPIQEDIDFQVEVKQSLYETRTVNPGYSIEGYLVFHIPMSIQNGELVFEPFLEEPL